LEAVDRFFPRRKPSYQPPVPKAPQDFPVVRSNLSRRRNGVSGLSRKAEGARSAPNLPKGLLQTRRGDLEPSLGTGKYPERHRPRSRFPPVSPMAGKLRELFPPLAPEHLALKRMPKLPFALDLPYSAQEGPEAFSIRRGNWLRASPTGSAKTGSEDLELTAFKNRSP